VVHALLTAIEIAAVVCGFATVIFVVAVRCLWRRGKKLREP
jgi:ABC-type spermidine/putrescine transport system permease subunit II